MKRLGYEICSLKKSPRSSVFHFGCGIQGGGFFHPMAATKRHKYKTQNVTYIIHFLLPDRFSGAGLSFNMLILKKNTDLKSDLSVTVNEIIFSTHYLYYVK
jgi:hypothetical protein